MSLVLELPPELETKLAAEAAASAASFRVRDTFACRRARRCAQAERRCGARRLLAD